ncbi:MAG: hypothetical protein V3T77_07100, partial [Planctomycetota bacterium]
KYLDRTVAAYEKAKQLDGKDGRAHFRLGVALRRRFESKERQPGDAQAAVASWGEALSRDPNQYIWRRRIQQYGPRLDKPYNFYFWVAEARAGIRARGETPWPLPVEPMGSEIASRSRQSKETLKGPNPDPEGQISRDSRNHVEIEAVVTPARVRPGQRTRLRVHFRLNGKPSPHWSNESEPLLFFASLPGTLSVEEGEFEYPNPKLPTSDETRVLELEIGVPADAKSGAISVPAYSLYNICEDDTGVCRYLRQDFHFTIHVDPKAPTLK